MIITAVRVRINQLAMRSRLSSSTVTDSESNNDFLTLAVHKLIIKLITSWIVLIDVKSNKFPTLIFTQSIDHDLGASSLSTEQFYKTRRSFLANARVELDSFKRGK